MDYAATAYMDERVKKAMEPYWIEEFGNPSALYKEGRDARMAVENARADVAKMIGARDGEIIFTNGGTESDNLAIFGVAGGTNLNCLLSSRRYPRTGWSDDSESKQFKPCSACGANSEGKLSGSTYSDDDSEFKQAKPVKNPPHIITTKIEHHAVLRACKKLEKEGFEITYLKTDKHGLITPKQIIDALKNKTLAISVMYANNEIGTIEPIADIGKAILKWKKENKRKPDQPPFFHTDACQAAGYLDLNVNKLHVDLLTINGSKIYGPKGVGVLYKSDHVKLEPMLFGGGQEFRFRAGTENVQGIVGTAKALEIADKTKEKEIKRLTKLRDYFIKEATKQIPNTTPNGHPELRLPNNVNLTFLGVEGEALLLYLDEYGISASTGSACTSESLDPSHVILALGRPYEYAHGSIRFSLGRCTKKGDIDYVLEILPRLVEKLREISALSRKPQAVKP